MAEVLAKAENTSTVRKPFYLSGKTLPRKRRKAGARKRENEALGDKETGIDPHEGTTRTENSLQREEATSGTAWAHHISSYNNDIHPENSPPCQPRCHRSYVRRNMKSF